MPARSSSKVESLTQIPVLQIYRRIVQVLLRHLGYRLMPDRSHTPSHPLPRDPITYSVSVVAYEWLSGSLQTFAIMNPTPLLPPVTKAFLPATSNMVGGCILAIASIHCVTSATNAWCETKSDGTMHDQHLAKVPCGPGGRKR